MAVQMLRTSWSPSSQGILIESMRPSSKIKTVCRQSRERVVDELVDILVDEDLGVDELEKDGGRACRVGRLAINEVASSSGEFERRERSLHGLSSKSWRA